MTTLVPSGPPEHQDLEELRARAAELETVLRERGAEVARVSADLDAFKIRYRHEVGLLHDELDELDRAIAEGELGELARQRDRGTSGPNASTQGPRMPTQPRYTTDAVRRLFRDVAKAVHPDLADDDCARDRRHALMVEANRAYALGDEQRLRSILQAWARSPDTVPAADAQATRVRLVRRIAEVEEQLTAYANELAALKASPIGTLKAMVDDASSRGKDLVGDMVRRLKRDILAAHNRLDAMRSPR